MKTVDSSQLTVHSKRKTVNREPITVNRSGQVLIIAIVFLAVVLIISATMFSRVANFLRFGTTSVIREQATHLAEAAIDKAIWQLNETAGSYSGEANTPLGTIGTFTVTITSKTSSLKTITATGYVPNATNPKAKRTIKVDTLISTAITSFNYAIQVGTGGLTMGNNAVINGSVYSNKTGQSITAGSGSTITGDAYAVGTIPNPPIVNGLRRENQAPSQMPQIDYIMWQNAASSGGTTDCSSTCTISGIQTIGPRKYAGNIVFTNNATITVHGPLWITGNISTGNSVTFNVDESLGSSGTILMTDGQLQLGNTDFFNPTTANPNGYLLVVSTSSLADAIHIGNSTAKAIFYALNGGIDIGNNAKVTAAVGNSLTLGNNLTLNYDQGLASASFTAGPAGSWQIKKGTYRFTSSP